jgi:hypothetical protein
LRDAARVAAAPLLAAAAVGVVSSGTSLRLRYEASESAMNEIAQDVTAGSKEATKIDRIGMWRVDGVERVRRGMRFAVEGTGVLGSVGFAYSAHGHPPDVSGGDRYEHYDGPWWIWSESGSD